MHFVPKSAEGAVSLVTGVSIETYPVYLKAACEPIRLWLEDPAVVEIMVNRAGVVWVEFVGRGIERFDVPTLTSDKINRICNLVAGDSDQSVNKITPALSAPMPNGERFQALLAPAATEGGAFSIRKQVISDLTLEKLLAMGGLNNVRLIGAPKTEEIYRDQIDTELLEILKDNQPNSVLKFLRRAVEGRKTILISGGTSSGKTTFLNGLLKEVPLNERVISIEDTRELKPPHQNYVPMVVSKGGQGLSKATVSDLVQVALRMRPDRIFLGEMRGGEAAEFLHAVNSGHPGSLSTVHADTALLAYHRIALMVLQAGLGLTLQEILDYVRSVVPIVVQLRGKPQRGVAEIYYNCWS